MANLRGFALIGTFSPTGDGDLPPSAEAALVPTSTTAGHITPSTPLFVIWNCFNIVQVRITGDNGIDPPFDSGFINTTGLTSGSFDIVSGFTEDTNLIFTAYDTLSHIAVTQILPAIYHAALVGLVISPSNPIIPVGGTQQFTALGVYSDSSTAPVVASWSSSNTGNATIDSGTGLATGVTAGGGGTTITATFSTFIATTHLGISNDVTRIPALVDSEGLGAAWMNTSAATSSGVGHSQGVIINGFTITSGVVTFVTAPQSLQSGQQVVLSSFNNGLNGLTVTVLVGGLSSTSFTANVALGDTGLTNAGGTATPTTAYAIARRRDIITPGPGQYALYVPGGDSSAVSDGTNGNFPFGIFLPAFVSASMAGNVGTNGFPVINVTSTSSSVPTPTLPPGATVVAVYAYLVGNHVQVNGSGNNTYILHSTSGNFTFVVNGSPSTTLLGSDPTVISTAYFTANGLSSLETTGPAYSWVDTIEAYGFEVIYTLSSGSPIPPDQIQNLTSKQFNFALPPPSTVLGLQVDFASGLDVGSGPVTLTIQPTLNNIPTGTPKTQTVSSWTTAYTFGGSSDLWGMGSLTDVQVNGSNGLGVIVSGTLPDGTQINLNSLQATLWYY